MRDEFGKRRQRPLIASYQAPTSLRPLAPPRGWQNLNFRHQPMGMGDSRTPEYTYICLSPKEAILTTFVLYQLHQFKPFLYYLDSVVSQKHQFCPWVLDLTNEIVLFQASKLEKWGFFKSEANSACILLIQASTRYSEYT